jgi:hypothetical protein
VQGEKMSKDEFNIIDSILTVTASSGSLNDEILNDLNLPEGKSIAELLDGKEKNPQKQD